MSKQDLQELQLKTDLEIKKLLQETTSLFILKFYGAILLTVAVTAAVVTAYFKFLAAPGA